MKKPLYEDIKNFIKEKIEDKTYQEGDKILTEMELAKMFKTSRQTANKALRDLVLEGYVKRFPRSGTFVKEKVAQSSLLELKNIADEVKSRGNTYTNKLLSLQAIKADEDISKALHVVKDQEIYISQMIHYENNVPVRFDIRYVNPSFAKNYIKQDFTQITPSEYLQKHCPAQKVENTIEAKMANKDIQKYLRIQAHEPCLKISRVVKSNNKIASYSKIYYPSSRYKLVSTFCS